ncbi:UTRA domain-containing protein [Terasakiella sp. A23]|uniref:UTRA domain-containing protein n=1 Tax=Terasakiella sp. FCG-A23 TaxID=3080561 RepID=UPI0029534C45|nr:UTRA domain-containing protein [Terasakiella sp. A23]MDV7341498.1 UTRA domain-containing protein [Terasakiella sp. A23]
MVKKSGQSSFQMIHDDILNKIKTRHWMPGETIPGEEALAVTYGCSRMTVNRAIRELAAKGIVERRRKAGTRVMAQPDRSAKICISVVRKEVESRGARYRYVLLERDVVVPNDGVRAKLAIKQGQKALHLRCLHFADEVPFQYEERWINLQRVPKAEEQDFHEKNPNEWLIAEEPFLEAEHVFSAQLADGQLAELLNVKEGSPLFVVERRTWQGDDTITSVKLSYPGDSYKLVSRD